ncbi:DUF7523 family protein [Natranaeroarchaeum aerophilus]|uniref:ACT domain-containing protein n=1 Tax=Natranaeroarchaeum aerophilus TaxID=2917711 RepID=A0AAE3FQS9_9EURY|nr:hypothetical protein [Natranaeroarchaeum aerophilus]MCL9812929.1 hypothetical protein [Natranaeroarchaeum aerophilus]
MSLAEQTRAAVREQPFLFDALRADVLNYTAAARFLEIDGDEEAIATALRRYGEELESYDEEPVRATVTMQRRVGITEAPDPDALLRLGEVGVEPDGPYTAISASGDVPPGALGSVCQRLQAAGIELAAAAGVDGELTLVVDNDDAANALRIVEDAVGSLPVPDGY